jgi:hypothetical protein
MAKQQDYEQKYEAEIQAQKQKEIEKEINKFELAGGDKSELGGFPLCPIALQHMWPDSTARGIGKWRRICRTIEGYRECGGLL